MNIVKIQEDNYGLHCPFCGKKVLDSSAFSKTNDPNDLIKPCEHTVFFAMTGAGDDLEELFPYISEKDRPQIEAVHNSKKGKSFYLEDLIKKVEVPNSLCFYQESDSAFMSGVEGYLAFAQREVKHD